MTAENEYFECLCDHWPNPPDDLNGACEPDCTVCTDSYNDYLSMPEE